MLSGRIIGEREIVTRLEDLFSDAMMTLTGGAARCRQGGRREWTGHWQSESHDIRELGQTFVFKYKNTFFLINNEYNRIIQYSLPFLILNNAFYIVLFTVLWYIKYN